MACCVESASSFSRGFIRGWVAVLGIKHRVQDKIGVALEPGRWADGPAMSHPFCLGDVPFFDRERASIGARGILQFYGAE